MFHFNISHRPSLFLTNKSLFTIIITLFRRVGNQKQIITTRQTVVCTRAISLNYQPAPKDAGFHVV
ncbi:hypothetical protein FJN11_06510 [Streptococcus symci]|uniref:Uncharacterized protein n=1 Tax=Streptococcus symci TaxID=2588991 RepID=A0A501PAV6_9STRE|nr:hypothetical protein FJN11_06510 [Streptococcus symci]